MNIIEKINALETLFVSCTVESRELYEQLLCDAYKELMGMNNSPRSNTIKSKL
jgi:hypothetical protein